MDTRGIYYCFISQMGKLRFRKVKLYSKITQVNVNPGLKCQSSKYQKFVIFLHYDNTTLRSRINSEYCLWTILTVQGILMPLTLALGSGNL